MWCDVRQCDRCPLTKHHTHLDKHTHSQTSGCAPAVAEHGGSHLWVTPVSWLVPAWGGRGWVCGCMPADPTCSIRPVDPVPPESCATITVTTERCVSVCLPDLIWGLKIQITQLHTYIYIRGMLSFRFTFCMLVVMLLECDSTGEH